MQDFLVCESHNSQSHSLQKIGSLLIIFDSFFCTVTVSINFYDVKSRYVKINDEIADRPLSENAKSLPVSMAHFLFSFVMKRGWG